MRPLCRERQTVGWVSSHVHDLDRLLAALLRLDVGRLPTDELLHHLVCASSSVNCTGGDFMK